jgi:streptomycin 6-kinase
MSAFGDGTFKQNILEEIEYRMKDHNMTRREVASELAYVLAYMCDSALWQDEEIAKVKAQAKIDARKELTDLIARSANV